MKLHSEKVPSKKHADKFRIRYWENGKNRILPKDQHPDFKTKFEGDTWCKQKNEKFETAKLISQHQNLNEIAFKNDSMGDLNHIVQEFLVWHKNTATNTHETAKCWLLIYIFPFFLYEKKAQYGMWPQYFEEFKEHLMSVVSEKTGKPLSYSSRNHVIKYLNLFLVFLKIKKKSIAAFDKCSYFPKSLVNARGIESLVTKNEQHHLVSMMDGDESLEFYYILLNTGLRLNELFSLQAACVDDQIDKLKPLILKPFQTMGLHIFGYIRLESQVTNPHPLDIRDESGAINRKPLKCRKKISQENHRIIPIYDKKAWDILVKYRRRAYKDFSEKRFKSNNVNDYLLFNIPLQRLTKAISRHFNNKKSAHCARHSYTTELATKFLQFNIGPEYVRHITGHGIEEWRRYTHLVLDEEGEKRKREFSYF